MLGALLLPWAASCAPFAAAAALVNNRPAAPFPAPPAAAASVEETCAVTALTPIPPSPFPAIPAPLASAAASAAEVRSFKDLAPVSRAPLPAPPAAAAARIAASAVATSGAMHAPLSLHRSGHIHSGSMAWLLAKDRICAAWEGQCQGLGFRSLRSIQAPLSLHQSAHIHIGSMGWQLSAHVSNIATVKSAVKRWWPPASGQFTSCVTERSWLPEREEENQHALTITVTCSGEFVGLKSCPGDR